MNDKTSSKDERSAAALQQDDGVLKAIDRHVGERLRQRRKFVGMTQVQLGEASGLVFQQIQKYERGANRIGAARLYQFAKILCVDIEWFYRDIPADLRENFQVPGFGEDMQENLRESAQDSSRDNPNKEACDVAQAYSRITDASQRESIKRLIESVAPAAKKTQRKS